MTAKAPQRGFSGSLFILLTLLLFVGGCGQPSGSVDSAAQSAQQQSTGQLAEPDESTTPTVTEPEGYGPPVVMGDPVIAPFEGWVDSASVVVVGTIRTVAAKTTWSTPDGNLEPTYSSGEMPGGPPEEWQVVTVTVDKTLIDKTGSLGDGASLEVRYPVIVPSYAELSASLVGRQILATAYLDKVPFTDGSLVEMMTVFPQATYVAADSGDMIRLFSAPSGLHYSELATDNAKRRSEADAVDLAALIDRVENPSKDPSDWLGSGDTFPRDDAVPDPGAEEIIP